MTQSPGTEAMVAEILQGSAPERIRSAAARGALPLPRTALIRLWVYLREDSAETIRADAEHSLTALGVESIRECLVNPACDPKVLSHFAGAAARNEAIAEPIVFNTATPDSAMARLAATGSIAVVDLVLTNQERLLASPALLQAMIVNPGLRPAQRGTLLELLARADQDSSKQVSENPEVEPVEDDSFEEIANLLDVDVGELLAASEIVDGAEFEESPIEEIRGAYQKIMTLNTAQKAVLAMKGGREERLILIRDTNKTVSMGALKNPRITDSEIESIARMRNVSEEILRHVGSKRDWTKNYQVVLGLVTNPRAPQSTVMNFVTRLTTRDLRNLVSSREVPELIRRQARRIYDIRTKPATSPFRK